MSEHLALLSKFQAAQKAVDDLLAEGYLAAQENSFALDMCRRELCAIDDLLRPVVGGSLPCTLDSVREVVAMYAKIANDLADSRSAVARLEDADRLRSQAHMVVVEDNVKLRAEVTSLRSALSLAVGNLGPINNAIVDRALANEAKP